MQHRIMTLCAGALALLTAIPAEATATTTTTTTTSKPKYEVVSLVSDVKGQAAVQDPKVVNPWGLAMGKTLWVANAGTGSATVYTTTGGATLGVKKEATEVAIPGGTPTGQVSNPGSGFTVKGKPATFLFASPSGAITGWNAEADPANAIIGAFTRGADYKGLAMVGDSLLLAADFAGGKIHAFDSDFRRRRLSRGQFHDPRVPKDYRPFNVSAVGDGVWVSYALRDSDGKPVKAKGKGFVSRFTQSGRLTGRISRGALNAPWAVAQAPRGFGAFAGAMMVGNFGDGTVQVFKRGRYVGPLRGAGGKPIVLPGLWGLEPGTAANGGENAMWFSAGIDAAKHGLVGLLRPAGSSPAAPPAATATPSAAPPAASASPSAAPSSGSASPSGAVKSSAGAGQPSGKW